MPISRARLSSHIFAPHPTRAQARGHPRSRIRGENRKFRFYFAEILKENPKMLISKILGIENGMRLDIQSMGNGQNSLG